MTQNVFERPDAMIACWVCFCHLLAVLLNNYYTTTKTGKNPPPIKMFGTTQRTESNICQGLRIWKNFCHFYNSTTSLQLASTHALENPKLILPDTFFYWNFMFQDLLRGGFSRPQPVYVPDISNWQHQSKAYATRRSDSGEEGLGDFSSRLGETLSATAVTHLNQVLPWPVTYFSNLYVTNHGNVICLLDKSNSL